MSLVEIVITLGLTSSAVLAVLALTDIQGKESLHGRQVATMDSLKNKLDYYLRSPESLTLSARAYARPGFEGNMALARCFPRLAGAPPTGQCKNTAPSGFQPFLYLDPSDLNKKAILGGTEATTDPDLAQTPAAPARFTSDGAPCAASSPACPFEVVTRFAAECPADQPACDIPSQLVVSYIVRLAPGVKLATKRTLAARTGSLAVFPSSLPILPAPLP